ncbi:hypothetical protein BSL78_22299 [Apostichopus japonicus]|uniref:MARVEL domain-containing protein n=1 Tax=Stichopus japonicus TaxID=307972 RepID=A0A2G8JYS9_STIJA|nr:hypothetical protein BSL78_22299 [Apostichopus japonicus]
MNPIDFGAHLMNNDEVTGSNIIMADGDFPDSYETKTTTTTTSSTTVCTYNAAYVKTLDGLLRIAEIVVGLIYWICVVATGGYPGQGFVISATIIIWIFTIIIFCLYLFMVVERITIINWPLSEFISNVIWAIFHFIGIIILIVTVSKYAVPFAFWVSFLNRILQLLQFSDSLRESKGIYVMVMLMACVVCVCACTRDTCFSAWELNNFMVG